MGASGVLEKFLGPGHEGLQMATRTSLAIMHTSLPERVFSENVPSPMACDPHEGLKPQHGLSQTHAWCPSEAVYVSTAAEEAGRDL